MRGYYAIGVVNGKTPQNIGTLWRSAAILGASFIFTVGVRYNKQASDTVKAWKHLPLFNYATLDDLVAALPFSCPLVGVELDAAARPLGRFHHPERAVYLLGAEDRGLTKEALGRCHHLVSIPGDTSLNVAVAGSIVLYDRINKRESFFGIQRGSEMAAD